MIRLTKLADYGIAVMTRLARDGMGRRVAARQLACDTGLPLPTVSKILKLLTQGGLLESQRGADGGYTLARDPDEITIVEVVTALEGPMSLTECSTGDGCDCDLRATCDLKQNWKHINTQVMETLGSFTVSQMVGSLAEDRTS